MPPPNVLMIGAGEYTTGYVPTAGGVAADKSCGVVGITMFDLREKGKVNNLFLCDAVGTKFPAIRDNFRRKIDEVYQNLSSQVTTVPEDDVEFDPEAYKRAIAKMSRGDVAIIFTPDNTHFPIAMACVEHGLHVLVAKPLVKTLGEHLQLIEAARQHSVLVAIEYHKRFDPIYTDARDRIRTLGGFSFFTSTMTQPKKQLDTFAAWAGKSSDINFYLNSHHMDIHCWSVRHMARPERVTAMAATGVADARLKRECEDTIVVMAQWRNLADNSVGVASYMASWVSPPADCYTQQYFHYMGHKGEVRADQGHRGFTSSTDAAGFNSINPLYMKYTPDARGRFSGQNGYGYRSLAEFVDVATKVNEGALTPAEVTAEDVIATVDTTLLVTAMLEAGRRSLDAKGKAFLIQYDANGLPCGVVEEH